MSNTIAVDLGTARTLVADTAGSLLVDEPTVAAVDAPTGDLLAFGREARQMRGRGAGEVVIVKPVRHGQLEDLALTHDVADWILKRSRRAGIYKPDVVCCVPSAATGVQRRALERSFKRAGAKAVSFLDQAVAVAIGARLSIAEPVASMVVDVGAGTSDMAVMALGGVVTSSSTIVGGDDFDEAIRTLLRTSFDLVVPRATAEGVKLELGTAWPETEVKVEVTGRSLGDGSPRTVVLSSSEVAGVLDPHVETIVSTAVSCIVTAPPDLSNDLLSRGLYLAGGGGLLDGFDRRLASAAGIPIHIVEDPQLVAVRGVVRSLRYPLKPSPLKPTPAA